MELLEFLNHKFCGMHAPEGKYVRDHEKRMKRRRTWAKCTVTHGTRGSCRWQLAATVLRFCTVESESVFYFAFRAG